MATRVNKKVIIVVSACTLIGVGVVGFVVAQQYRADPTRFVNAGDQAMIAGNAALAAGDKAKAANAFEEAARNYGRAIGKRRNNVEYHGKFIEASRKIVPVSSDQAREKYLLYVGSLLTRAQIARNNATFWREVLSERRQQSELNDSPVGWQSLHDVVAQDMTTALSPDDKLFPVAKVYQAYAQARRVGALAPEEVADAVRLLDENISKVEGDDLDLAFGAILGIRFQQAMSLETAGQGRQATEAWTSFDTLLAKAKQDAPKGVQTLLWNLARLRVQKFSNDSKVTAEQVGAAADALASRCLELDDPTAVFEASKAIGAPGVPDGFLRASKMLDTYLAVHPDSLVHRRGLSFCLQFSDPDRAAIEAQKIIDMPMLPVSLASAAQDEMRIAAAQQIFDLQFARLGDAEDEAAQAAIMPKLDAAAAKIRELAAGFADNSAVLRTEGKLAYARKDYAVADTKFKEVFKKNSGVDVELYVLAAAAAEQLKETGQAQQLIDRGLELAPGNVQLLERRGMLEFRNGRFDAAERTFEAVLNRDATRAESKRFLAEIKTQKSGGLIDANDPLVRRIKEIDDLRLANKLDEARKLAEPMLEEQKKIDPMKQIVQVYVLNAMIEGAQFGVDTQAGNAEKAAKTRQKALDICNAGMQISPNNPQLSRIITFLSSDDPAKRVETAVAQEHPTEPDRTVWTAIRLHQVAETTLAESRRLAATNKPESERTAAIVPSLRKAAGEWKEKAMQLDPTNPALLDFRFTIALVDASAAGANDFKPVEAVIADADKSTTRNPTLPPLFRARLALVRGEAGVAVDVLQKAIDRNVDSADVWRLLGAAQEQTGEMNAAVKSYAEAYRRRPTDMNGVRVYVTSLIRTGDRGVALTVLRDARKIAGEDMVIGDTWLDLESEIGDKDLARRMRKTRYELVPADRSNAIKYATLLAELQPDRESVRDPSGKPKYNDSQWRALDGPTQTRELDLVRKDWLNASDDIFQSLLAKSADPGYVELVMLRSATFRRQGRYDEAAKVIDTMISGAGSKATAEMYIGKGVHFAEVGNAVERNAAFAKAVELQDPVKLGADASIAEYYFQKSQWQLAIDHLEKLAARVKAQTPAQRVAARLPNATPEERASEETKEKNSDRNLALRMAEAHGRLQQFDLARQKIAEATVDGKRDIVTDQLEASLLEGQGQGLRLQADALQAKGDTAGAKAKLAEATAAYEAGLTAVRRARAAAKGNPGVAVQEASLLRKQWDARSDERDDSKLDAALKAADEATKLRGDYWPAAQAKSDLLLAKKDPAGAIVELERFTKAAPSNADGRRELIKFLINAGKSNRAVEVCREAISLSPNDPMWRSMLGEVELANGRLDEAILALSQADKLRPDDAQVLQRVTDLRLRRQPANWQDVLDSLRDRNAIVEKSPYLQSAIGAALANTGELKGGLESMRASYLFAKRGVAEGISQPDVIDSWYTNLRLIYPVARTAEAEKFVNEISANKPDLRDTRWLAEMWFASGSDGVSRANELATKALGMDDNKDPQLTARLYDMIGSIKYGQGDCKGALEQFAKAVETLPSDASVLNNYAYLCGECSDDPKRGLESALRAVSLAPGRAEYLDTLGFVQGRAGLKDDAIENLQRSLKLQASASANVHLAQVLLDVGRKDDAKMYLQAAGNLKPDAVLQKQINSLIERLR